MNKRQAILEKLGIETLNPMQIAAAEAIEKELEVILLSPTGSGKTLAYLLPLIELMQPEQEGVQAMILVPSRELALQIEQVFREMGSGYKAAAVYGGRSIQKDFEELQHTPALIIGTPGRVADHMRRDSFETGTVLTLILDEFDKSLEVGFSSDMKEIIRGLFRVNRSILTSATSRIEIPDYVGMTNPHRVDFSQDEVSNLALRKVGYSSKSKSDILLSILSTIGEEPCIVFCNFKVSLQQLSETLKAKGISHGTFHGDMEQQERERSLIKFRNGSHRILVATDLAARGIDIPELAAIVHYELPPREQEYVHRNGRTARMAASGTAYAMYDESRQLPEFIHDLDQAVLADAPLPLSTERSTLIV